MFEKLRGGLAKVIEKMSTIEFKTEELDSILWEFKLTLLENDVALEVADRVCEDVKENLVGAKVNRFGNRKEMVEKALREALRHVLQTERNVNLLDLAERKKRAGEPLIIVFVGINGSGKTTTIAKVAKLLLTRGYSVVLASSDTYRTGAIEQLEEHAKRLGVRLIKHRYGADAAAVAFDAVSHAKAQGVNAVLIDTAGRMQTNRNLMEEMQKIVRVVKPDLTLFVGDALTGNDAVSQAEEFGKFVSVDGSVLTKVDADAKGGAAVSITYVTKRPIVFLGIGQRYEDLTPFDTDFLMKRVLE